MSASIDKGPGGSDEDSREVLAAWLDDYIAGRCDRARMHESFLDVCRSNPEAPWDALALLDQYQRRGRVDVALARSLKAEIAQLVFGVATQTEEQPRDSEATLDTTGSRWRKLYAERGHQSVNDDDAVTEDPALRRDFEPMTRPPPMARAPRPRDPSRPVADRAPATVGVGTILRERYELMEVIGTGRSGTVYQAFDRHRSHLPSPSCYVAVRVLNLPGDGREAALAELERESYAAQSLSHPNIISVFDLDRHSDTYFVVMELLEGESLHDVIERLAGKPMSQERAFAVIGAIGAALTHAHQRNIFHGDLKPSAVQLTTNGEIKVLDFGFARSHTLDQWVGGEPTVDGAGATTTAAYASAERVSGEEPQARDDVYSLACIAYELLSGRHPFGGRSAPLARAHGRAPQKISGLNSRQWHALQNALNWNREDRRIDVAELLAVLGCSDSGASVAPLVVPQRPLDNPFGRGKGMLLAVILVVVAAALAWWQLPRFIEPESVSPVAGPAGVDPERPAPASATPPDRATGPAEQPRPAAAKSVPPPVSTPATSPTQAAPSKGTQAKDTPAASKDVPLAPGVVAATADPPSTPKADTNSRPARENPSAASVAAASAEPVSASRAATIEFDKDTYVATESDGMVKLTVRRNGTTRNEVKFRWRLRANSAEAGSDFAGIGPDTEEILPGNRTATITIPLVSDVVAENTELFLVELEQVEGGPALGEQAHAAVILVDDD
jgi:serine/threonine protein kinase